MTLSQRAEQAKPEETRGLLEEHWPMTRRLAIALKAWCPNCARRTKADSATWDTNGGDYW